MKTPLRNKHFRIIAECSGKYRIGPQVFNSMDDLVEHYTRHAIYRLGAEKLFLVKPFAKGHGCQVGCTKMDSAGDCTQETDVERLPHDHMYEM
jgi:hypothetical protein